MHALSTVFLDFDHPPNRERALKVIDRLQIQEAGIFNPRAAYDGQKNMFRQAQVQLGGQHGVIITFDRSRPLDLPNNGGIFKVYMGDVPPPAGTNPKGIDVKITKVAVIDSGYAPNRLEFFDFVTWRRSSIKAVLNGQGAHSSDSLMTITLLNILIRMKPIM